jgi:glyoxylase-like metal-dependent hydrolase (beta-lactamase superfamily II)
MSWNFSTGVGKSRGILALTLAIIGLAGVAFVSPAHAAAEGQADNSNVHVMHVQGNVYMLVEPGMNNVTVQIGDEYIIVVDPGEAQYADEMLAKIKSLSSLPIMFIVNTSADPDHYSANAKVSQAGWALPNAGITGADPAVGLAVATKARLGSGAPILGHADTIFRSTSEKLASNSITYHDEGFKLYNDEAVIFYHMKSAHSNGDSMVYFRKSDVISVGELFCPFSYPVIDTENGGTLNGLIGSLNDVIDLMVPKENEEGGTYVIPGHGHLSDRNDIVNYRDMLTIIRGRVQDLIRKGMKLDQVKAAKPSFDYDRLFSTSAMPADKFTELVYHELTNDKSQQGKK